MPTTLHENRPSAGIGVVEVQKPMVFSDFQHARATLCGDRRGRGAKTHAFCDFCGARATLCGDRRGRGAKTHGFFAISAVLARTSAGIGVVEVQKPMVFFAISAVPAQPSAGIGVIEVQKAMVFCDLCCSNWSSGVVSWFARLLPEPAGPGFDSSLVRGRASQDATCILKQLAQSNLRRASCTEQLAQSNLHRPVCAERQLAHRAACTEQLAGSAICTEQLAGSHLQGPTCRSNLRGATCAEQLAQCNLRRATCADQLAPTSLRRAPCLVLSRACFTNASWREKERILQHWADLTCDVMLSGQPWSSFFLERDINGENTPHLLSSWTLDFLGRPC